MFVELPLAFNLPGKISLNAIERYWKEDVAAKATGPYQIHVQLVSKTVYIAGFDDAGERDTVYAQFDRYLTGKDKAPQFDTESW